MGGLWDYLSGSAGFSGFGSRSTAEDVTFGTDLSSKTIISGATSGIRKEAARVFAKRGAHVITAIRNSETEVKVKPAITAESPQARVDVMKLDLASVESVHPFANDFRTRKLPLNVPINNAGYMSWKFELSADGLEKVFATNLIGSHFNVDVGHHNDECLLEDGCMGYHVSLMEGSISSDLNFKSNFLDLNNNKLAWDTCYSSCLPLIVFSSDLSFTSSL